MNEHSSLESWDESPRGAADHRGDGSKQEPQTPPFPRSVDEDSSKTITSRSRPPLKFFLLVFALSIPFALIGVVTGLQLFPGILVVPSIKRALKIAGAGKPGRSIRLVFPIDPEAFFIPEDSGRREVA